MNTHFVADAKKDRLAEDEIIINMTSPDKNRFDNRFAWFDMRKFVLMVILFMLSCAGIKQKRQNHNDDSFLINKIESKDNWYIVYACRHDSVFMIVSKKTEIVNQNWAKIIIGKYYNLRLSSIIPVINGVKMFPVNYLDYAGISLDEQTFVNINPSKGIFDVYSAENLKGLFLKE